MGFHGHQKDAPMTRPTITPQILACFTLARRRHLGLSPLALERELDVPRGQVRAVESCQRLSPANRQKFMDFNKLED